MNQSSFKKVISISAQPVAYLINSLLTSIMHGLNIEIASGRHMQVSVLKLNSAQDIVAKIVIAVMTAAMSAMIVVAIHRQLIALS